jgi:hypothetical protein
MSAELMKRLRELEEELATRLRSQIRWRVDWIDAESEAGRDRPPRQVRDAGDLTE